MLFRKLICTSTVWVRALQMQASCQQSCLQLCCSPRGAVSPALPGEQSCQGAAGTAPHCCPACNHSTSSMQAARNTFIKHVLLLWLLLVLCNSAGLWALLFLKHQQLHQLLFLLAGQVEGWERAWSWSRRRPAPIVLFLSMWCGNCRDANNSAPFEHLLAEEASDFCSSWNASIGFSWFHLKKIGFRSDPLGNRFSAQVIDRWSRGSSTKTPERPQWNAVTERWTWPENGFQLQTSMLTNMI